VRRVSGEASIDEVAPVLDLAETLSERADEVVGIGECGVDLAVASQ
jgi:Tat protein secretion system quality control protein TatD with DNase activity